MSEQPKPSDPEAGQKIAIYRKRCPHCDGATARVISGGENPDLWTCENGHRAEIEWVSTFLGHLEPVLHMLDDPV